MTPLTLTTPIQFLKKFKIILSLRRFERIKVTDSICVSGLFWAQWLFLGIIGYLLLLPNNSP